VRGVELADAYQPGRGPGRQLGVGVTGADEVAPDVLVMPSSA
jgi:hypothetical protein